MALAGAGRITVGMAQGFDLQLTRHDERSWRATFYTTRMEHSLSEGDGLGLGADAMALGAYRAGPRMPPYTSGRPCRAMNSGKASAALAPRTTLVV